MRNTLAGSRMTPVGARMPAVHSAVAECAGAAAAAAGGAGAPVTEQETTGPASGWPSRIWQESAISSCRTRCLSANVPLVLPASSSSHRPSATFKTACRQETRGSSTTMSDTGSRPIMYSRSGRKVTLEPWARTTSCGPAIADLAVSGSALTCSAISGSIAPGSQPPAPAIRGNDLLGHCLSLVCHSVRCGNYQLQDVRAQGAPTGAAARSVLAQFVPKRCSSADVGQYPPQFAISSRCRPGKPGDVQV